MRLPSGVSSRRMRRIFLGPNGLRAGRRLGNRPPGCNLFHFPQYSPMTWSQQHRAREHAMVTTISDEELMLLVRKGTAKCWACCSTDLSSQSCSSSPHLQPTPGGPRPSRSRFCGGKGGVGRRMARIFCASPYPSGEQSRTLMSGISTAALSTSPTYRRNFGSRLTSGMKMRVPPSRSRPRHNHGSSGRYRGSSPRAHALPVAAGRGGQSLHDPWHWHLAVRA
jgi:hypothetical protein